MSLSQEAIGQSKPSKEVTIGQDKGFFNKDTEFMCGQVNYNEQAGVVTLINNVTLKSSKLEVEGASKVVYHEKTKTLEIYDWKEFTFSGKVIVKDQNTKKKNIAYTLGDDTIYLR